MTINNARKFVEKMKQDQNFRVKVLATTEPDDLFSFLREEDLPFSQRELVEAMAECMEQSNSKESIDTSSQTKIERSEEMENRETLIAPCGLDCGICELYLSRNNAHLTDDLISKGIPKEVLPCDGCRAIQGRCPVIHGKCATFECANENRILFCSECNDFPCMKLAPTADKADILPHNTKLYNLCVIQRLGVEELIERALEIKQSYYRGKIEIGEGPKLVITD
jgi:predicted ribosomally synthesized peptide with nif11-like leader